MRRLTNEDLDAIPATYIEYIPSCEQQKAGEIDVERSKKLYEYITVRNILSRAGVPLAELKQQTDRLWDKLRRKGVSAMRTIKIEYIPSEEQWERLDAIHKKLRKAGMFDGHSEEEMLRFKMDADQSHYIDCVLDSLEQDYYRYHLTEIKMRIVHYNLMNSS